MTEQRGVWGWIAATRAPLVLSLALFGLTFAVLLAVVQPEWFDHATPATVSVLFPDTAVGIFVRNAGVAVLLYTGVVTGGLSTVALLLVVAMYLGAAVRVAAHNAGAFALLGHVAAYSVFEFTAIVIAAAAGLTPIFAACRSRTSRTPWSRYFGAFPHSLMTLSVALATLGVGAMIESSIIGTA